MIAGLSAWGRKPTPLLPRAFRELWKEPLPDWVAAELGLAPGVGFEAMGTGLWVRYAKPELSGRIRSFAIQTVSARLAELLDVCPIRGTWPQSLDPRQVPFSARTRNCLERLGVLDDPGRMPRLTTRELFTTKGMGIISILDFACIVESVIEARDQEPRALADAADLLNLVDEPWVGHVSREDPRFSDVVPLGHGTVYERIDKITAEPQDPPLEERQLADAIPAIRRRIADLSALSLDQALQDLVQRVSGLEGKRLRALERRLGTDGEPPDTLDAAAAVIGVTRERMRQLQQRFLARVPPHSIFMPQLDAALQLAADLAPCSLSSATSALREAGLSAKSFDARSLVASAELLGRQVPFEIVQDRIRRIDSASAEQAIWTTAHRQASASGASNAEQVVAELEAKGISSSPNDVLAYLRSSREFEILDESWYWYPPAPIDRNRLRNITRKMLSVASPIAVAEIREGVQRHYRVRSSRGMGTWPLLVPPRAILLKFYSAHPEFTIDAQGNVSSASVLDYRKEANPTEVVLIEAIRSAPSQVMDRASLAYRCIDQQGMNGNTFSQYLYSSPVISHLGTDLWSLRGVRIDPAGVEAVRAANALRPREKRVIDHGWNEAGDLWIAARVPNETTRFVMGVPSPIRHVLTSQEFRAIDEHGIACGMVRTNADGMSYGGAYGAFLTRQGADEGDLLLATFKLADHQVELRLVDDDELDAISPTDY